MRGTPPHAWHYSPAGVVWGSHNASRGKPVASGGGFQLPVPYSFDI